MLDCDWSSDVCSSDLEDCCGATDHANHLAALSMIKMQGGVFGAVSNSRALLAALS
jgi:hypothetical protein